MFPLDITKIIYEYTAIPAHKTKINFALCMISIQHPGLLEDLKKKLLYYHPEFFYQDCKHTNKCKEGKCITKQSFNSVQVFPVWGYNKMFKYFNRNLSV